ncbi:MAG TPA: ATP-dependent DNA helicase RecG [bacterium]|nr:ATP-dependent DNA helicase RecG [bacterium]
MMLKTDQDFFQSSVQFVKGVGPRRGELLAKLGVHTVRDLVYLAPRRYEDRSRLKAIGEIRSVGQFETIRGTVLAKGKRRVRGGLWIFQLAVGDDTGVVYAVWFNQPYLDERFHAGDNVIIYGRVQLYGKKLQMQNPEYELIESDGEDCLNMGRIVPVYPLTEQLNQRLMRSVVRHALDASGPHIEETLPDEMRERLRLIGLRDALENLHYPGSFAAQGRARDRIVFEEFFLFQLALVLRKSRTAHVKGIAHTVDGDLQRTFIGSLPFPLTGAQKRVVEQIRLDMAQPKPMNRLVQGDVGCGKTIVAVAALLTAVDGGYQGALMAPTEVLAEQHYRNIKKLAGGLPVRIALLSGEKKKNDRTGLLEELRGGTIDILIGTHALIEESVAFKRLGVVVIDEQHKFGVAQRASLKGKGETPDVLVMTATPIPRTLSLTVYGDLDISVIDELPPGRQKVMTYWIGKNKLADAYGFISKQVKEGRQAYIIYPVIDESVNAELKAAVKMADHLAKTAFKGIPVGLVHGKLKTEEREAIMQGFNRGEIAILISTTVIEVGIDIPNATVILIENAERFGLAQLHQLRGRVARSSHKSFCILEGNPKTEDGVKRLSIMKKTSDGFVIAEEDLAIRGPGEFFGERQHGMPELKVGNIITDLAEMQRARKEAEALLADPGVKTDPRYEPLRRAFRELYKDKLNLISVG